MRSDRATVVLLGCSMLASTVVLPSSALADETHTVLLPELQAYFRLTETTRVFLMGRLAHDLSDDTSSGELGAHLDVTLRPLLRRHLRERDWERDKYFWVRIGYRLIGDLDGASHGPTEHRGIVEATSRAPLPWSMWLVNRARVDVRGLAQGVSERFRDRVRLERVMSVADHTVIPYVGVEVFYDTRFGAWSRERYEAGAEIQLSEHWRVEPYVRRNENHRPSRTHENGVGLILKYYQ